MGQDRKSMGLSMKHKDGSPLVGLRDPSVKQGLATLGKKVLICSALITVAMWLFIPIYFGAYYRQTENAYRLNVIILDLDSAASTLSSSPLSPSVTTGSYTAVLGPAIVSAAENIMATQGGSNVNATTWSLGYIYPTQEEIATFSLPVKTAEGTIEYTSGVNASQWCDQRVLDQDVWGCLLVHGNATMMAWNALSGSDAAYDPNGAIHFSYEEARNFYSSSQYVASQVGTLIHTATSTANAALISTVLVQASAGVNGGVGYLTTTAAREALTGTFWYSEYNLRPFDQLAAEASTTAASIYLVIFTFFCSLQWSQILGPVRKKLSLGSEVALKILPVLLAYLWISLMYSLVPMAFHVTFNRFYGRVGFFAYWMLNWITMSGLGFVMEFMLELLGLPFFPFFLLFWVILNVSVAFVDVADQDHFYGYAYAFPVWNEIDATKSLVFGTKDHLLQNYMVNLGWAVAFAGLMILLIYVSRVRAGRKAFKEEQARSHPNKKRIRVFL